MRAVEGDPPRPESVAAASWWLPDAAGIDMVEEPPVRPSADEPDPGRILVVDDHADMRAYLVRLLGRTRIAERVRHAFRMRDDADSKEDQALALLESAIEEAA